jgi:transcriptional regulator with XRE-family HTH domain
MRQSITHIGQLLGIISARRRALNLSQGQLADKLGISQTYLARIENGTRTLSLSRLMDLLNILDLDLVVQDRASTKQQEW